MERQESDLPDPNRRNALIYRSRIQSRVFGDDGQRRDLTSRTHLHVDVEDSVEANAFTNTRRPPRALTPRWVESGGLMPPFALVIVALLALPIVSSLQLHAEQASGTLPSRSQPAASAEPPEIAALRVRAAADDPDAQVALGSLYERGENGIEADPSIAAEWYSRAAGRGHAGAQFNLAVMYQEGHGVERSLTRAMAWYGQAAAQGDALAQFGLGSIYEETAQGFVENDVLAASWYHQAAASGLAAAQRRLGALYESGRGVPRDVREAMAWYRRAADQDDPDAQTRLGLLLSASDSASPDVVEAHKWLNLAASRGKREDQRVRAEALRDALAAQMTPAERREAQRRATEWHDTVGVERR